MSQRDGKRFAVKSIGSRRGRMAQIGKRGIGSIRDGLKSVTGLRGVVMAYEVEFWYGVVKRKVQKCVICNADILHSDYALTCSMKCKREEARLADAGRYDDLINDSTKRLDEYFTKRNAKK